MRETRSYRVIPPPPIITHTVCVYADYKYRIILLSLLFVVNISCNNASLVHLSLSVNQIVKSCVPLPTMVLSVAFERDANVRQTSLSRCCRPAAAAPPPRRHSIAAPLPRRGRPAAAT